MIGDREPDRLSTAGGLRRDPSALDLDERVVKWRVTLGQHDIEIAEMRADHGGDPVEALGFGWEVMTCRGRIDIIGALVVGGSEEDHGAASSREQDRVGPRCTMSPRVRSASVNAVTVRCVLHRADTVASGAKDRNESFDQRGLAHT